MKEEKLRKRIRAKALRQKEALNMQVEERKRGEGRGGERKKGRILPWPGASGSEEKASCRKENS